jgi:shikimate kinase
MKQFILVTVKGEQQLLNVNSIRITGITSVEVFDDNGSSYQPRTEITLNSGRKSVVKETPAELHTLIYADELEIQERFKALRSKPHPNQ